MTTDDQKSNETPFERVTQLNETQMRECLEEMVTAILRDKSTRQIPDIMQAHRLLAHFEVYDADAAWTDLEDQIRELEPR